PVRSGRRDRPADFLFVVRAGTAHDRWPHLVDRHRPAHGWERLLPTARDGLSARRTAPMGFLSSMAAAQPESIRAPRPRVRALAPRSDGRNSHLVARRRRLVAVLIV